MASTENASADEDLMRRVAGGSPEALALLHRRFARLIFGLAALAPQLVQEPEVRNLQDPRADRAALGIELSRVAPDGQEDVLHEVFGGGAVERPDGQADDQPREATVEQRERLLGALGDLAHQVLVAGDVLRR